MSECLTHKASGPSQKTPEAVDSRRKWGALKTLSRGADLGEREVDPEEFNEGRARGPHKDSAHSWPGQSQRGPEFLTPACPAQARGGGAGTSPRTVALRPGDSAQRSTPWCTVHENTGPCWKQDPDPAACLEARRTQHRKRLALSQASKGSNTALSPDAPLGGQRSPGHRALLGRPEAGSGGSLFVMKYTDAPEKHPSVERRHPSPHHGG